jgi:hypothetical protein
VELIYSTQCWIIVITESVCDQKDGYKNLLPFYRHDMRERLASVEKSCKLRQPFTSCRIQTGNSRNVYEIKRGRPSSSLQPQLALKKKKYPFALFPAQEVPTNNQNHLPKLGGRQRCKYPENGSKSSIFCEKCQVHLCLNKERNCFYASHTQ